MTEHDRTALLYGHDPTERIVAVERIGPNRVQVFRRLPHDRLESDVRAFTPWLVTSEPGALRIAGAQAEVLRLAGELPLNHLVTFGSWGRCLDAVARLRELGLPCQSPANPVDQYLALTGRTLFKGMNFDEIVRLQIDIETTGFNATREDTTVLAIALSTNRGHQEVLDGGAMSEADMLRAVTQRIKAIDPDVIEGHNIFNFDLPFLIERARRHRVALEWGRDDSAPRLGGSQRLKIGPRSIPFQPIATFGRHVIDTYQQIQRYDSAGELTSYGLKESIDALGLTRPDRVFVSAAEIATTFERDRARVLAYALDDVADVALLSSLTVPTEFYQSQILPRSFQQVAIGGPGEKINALMTRVYVALGHSLPLPEAPRPYPGGYTEVRRIGIFSPVVKCDVESLYPAIMLTDRIAPTTDQLGVYLGLLEVLTKQRLDAKRQMRRSSGAEQARWLGLQSSFKVLINSFYGYLGYGRALFNDYDAARRVTLRGQEIITRVVAELERLGAETIEIDTDGVYFRPPESVRGEESEERLVASVGARLPAGITLAHDGSFHGMISLKTKNYALLTHDGRVILKGSSLRSRRDEPVFRGFLREAARRFVDGSPAAVRELYLDAAERIQRRAVPVREISRWETITDKTFTSDANRRIAQAAEGERVGERVSVYQREDGSLARIEDYAGDEDVDYLLRRLRDMAERFRPLFADETIFAYHFPLLTARSDVAAARNAKPVQQLSLF